MWFPCDGMWPTFNCHVVVWFCHVWITLIIILHTISMFILMHLQLCKNRWCNMFLFVFQNSEWHRENLHSASESFSLSTSEMQRRMMRNVLVSVAFLHHIMVTNHWVCSHKSRHLLQIFIYAWCCLHQCFKCSFGVRLRWAHRIIIMLHVLPKSTVRRHFIYCHVWIIFFLFFFFQMSLCRSSPYSLRTWKTKESWWWGQPVTTCWKFWENTCVCVWLCGGGFT